MAGTLGKQRRGPPLGPWFGVPLTMAVLLGLALPAAAQSRDAAANRTVDLAINAHYLSTDFDTAQKLISATIDGCADQCSPKTLARAYMYLSIVLGAGKNDLAGAKEALISALAHDPGVKLDTGLAGAEVTRIFRDLGGTAVGEKATEGGAEPPAKAVAPDKPSAPAAGGGLACTPKVTEVETRRPIPVECRSSQEVSSVQLRYRPFGNKTWSTLPMARKGQSFRAQIPCKETELAGNLELYVRAEDASGEDVASWGSKAAPVVLRVVQKTEQEPPSYDDAEPPARCASKEDCPPNFPGCGSARKGGDVDWGGGCDNSSQCKPGLLCLDGACDNAPSCKTDGDCPTGRCVQGECRAEATPGGTRAYRKNWFGLEVAQDLAFVGGKDLCTQQNQTDRYVACYYADSDSAAYMNEPYPGVTVNTGLVTATTRVLLSYERALTPNLSLGVRAGYAFGGGPPQGRTVTYADSTSHTVGAVTAEGTRFFPFHLEARVTYWFGANALSRTFRPFVHVGGGLAEYDAKVRMPVRDCGQRTTPCPASTNVNSLGEVELDAWKKFGLQFAALGGGIVFAFEDRYGIKVDVNAIYTLPASGVVIQPSLGLVAGY